MVLESMDFVSRFDPEVGAAIRAHASQRPPASSRAASERRIMVFFRILLLPIYLSVI